MSCTQYLPILSSPAEHVPINLATLHQQTFEQIWSTIEEHNIGAGFDDIEREAVYDKYAEIVEHTQSADEFHQLMQEMIDEIPNGGARLISREERIESAIASGPNLRSIGAFTGIRDGKGEEPRLVVLHIMPNSAAAIAGLMPHEAILSINGQEVEVGQGAEAQRLLRISREDELLLLVRAVDGTPRFVTIRLGSKPPQASAIENKILPATDILYLRFPPNEGRNAIEELASAIDQFRNRDTKNGIIIDTRLMTGQRQSSILSMLPLLTDGLVLNRIEDGQTSEIEIQGVPSGLQASDDIPIVIIQGRDTSGLGEIFAAAMQSNGRATVIGQSSPGNVEDMQQIFMPNGSQLLLPKSTLIIPSNGRNIGQKGVEPDLIFETEWDTFGSGNDPFINQAVDFLNQENINAPKK